MEKQKKLKEKWLEKWDFRFTYRCFEKPAKAVKNGKIPPWPLVCYAAF